jgi:shikimate dehydrogenase
VTKKFAVFGKPIAQSKSPLIHSMFAKEVGIDICYQAILGNETNVEEDFERFFDHPDALGANVTMPFKENAARWVDSLTDGAKAAEAVNTIIRKENHFVGDSTDGVGLVSDLLRLDMQIENRKVLLIGAGGAARGAFSNIINARPAQVDILNRSLDNARRLSQVCPNEITTCIDQVDKLGCYDLIINATSLSLNNQLPTIDNKHTHGNTCVYDMVYKNEDTVFVAWAKSQGLQNVADGLGMLVGQAAESFYLWLGERPNVDSVIKALRIELQNS